MEVDDLNYTLPFGSPAPNPILLPSSSDEDDGPIPVVSPD
jgi:hypothetical protein